MNKVFLFRKSVKDRNNDAYEVEFHAGENNEVFASVSKDNQPLYKDVALVDLSGRKTRVPSRVHLALKAQPTERHTKMLECFQRICTARLAWSLGCFALISF